MFLFKKYSIIRWQFLIVFLCCIGFGNSIPGIWQSGPPPPYTETPTEHNLQVNPPSYASATQPPSYALHNLPMGQERDALLLRFKKFCEMLTLQDQGTFSGTKSANVKYLPIDYTVIIMKDLKPEDYDSARKAYSKLVEKAPQLLSHYLETNWNMPNIVSSLGMLDKAAWFVLEPCIDQLSSSTKSELMDHIDSKFIEFYKKTYNYIFTKVENDKHLTGIIENLFDNGKVVLMLAYRVAFEQSGYMTSEVTRAKAAIMQFHEESTRINLHSLGPALTRRFEKFCERLKQPHSLANKIDSTYVKNFPMEYVMIIMNDLTLSDYSSPDNAYLKLISKSLKLLSHYLEKNWNLPKIFNNVRLTLQGAWFVLERSIDHLPNTSDQNLLMNLMNSKFEAFFNGIYRDILSMLENTKQQEDLNLIQNLTNAGKIILMLTHRFAVLQFDANNGLERVKKALNEFRTVSSKMESSIIYHGERI